MVAPGGALVFTDSHSPAVPSTATRTTLPSCQESSRRAHSRMLAAGTTNKITTSLLLAHANFAFIVAEIQMRSQFFEAVASVEHAELGTELLVQHNMRAVRH